jgi:2-polyprenyl-3-methyl-5-hydroxy-6-metoxy-1,4-benzoquinol methylase
MVVFEKRSEQKELLDQQQIPVNDLYRNLHELDVINRLLGGHAVTLAGLEALNLDKNKTYTILDIGSGGGDTLKAIASWAEKKGLQLNLTGVDLKRDCINYAEDFCKNYPNIRFIQSDYRDVVNEGTLYDIIITSLFCHHLTGAELVSLFSWAATHAQIAFVMNDLHRNPLAYYSISWLTLFFSRSYLVKNDARLSVLRGFKRNELLLILRQAGIPEDSFNLQWKWAFRWLLIIRKK